MPFQLIELYVTEKRRTVVKYYHIGRELWWIFVVLRRGLDGKKCEVIHRKMINKGCDKS